MLLCCYVHFPGKSRQLLSNNHAIIDGSKESGQIEQARHSMNLTKLLVQSLHLLGVGGRIVTLLAVTGF